MRAYTAAASSGSRWGAPFWRFQLARGVFGNADVGRGYVDGESPGGWHGAAGGGVWLAFLDRRNTVSLGVNSSREGTLLRGALALDSNTRGKGPLVVYDA